jgi:hypothetical protein
MKNIPDYARHFLDLLGVMPLTYRLLQLNSEANASIES